MGKPQGPASFGRSMLLLERNCLVVSIQSSHSDAELKALCTQVAQRTLHKVRGVVLDLGGVGVVDSFSTHALLELYRVLRLYGAHVVISGIPPGVAFSMSLQGLRLVDVPVVTDLTDAISYLESRSAKHPRAAATAARHLGHRSH